jgi:hypothetical protein
MGKINGLSQRNVKFLTLNSGKLFQGCLIDRKSMLRPDKYPGYYTYMKERAPDQAEANGITVTPNFPVLDIVPRDACDTKPINAVHNGSLAIAFSLGNRAFLGTGQSGSSRFDDMWDSDQKRSITKTINFVYSSSHNSIRLLIS